MEKGEAPIKTLCFLGELPAPSRDGSPLLLQQKASHQGLDLITGRHGERPSRQQSCPVAFLHPATDASWRFTQGFPSPSAPCRLKMRGAGCEGRAGQEEESWMKRRWFPFELLITVFKADLASCASCLAH